MLGVTDLTAPNPWTSILTLTAGDDGLLPLVDPAPPVGHAYYRHSVGAIGARQPGGCLGCNVVGRLFELEAPGSLPWQFRFSF